MPNIIKNKTKVTNQKSQSQKSFKPRLLTLCCKDRKMDKNDQWYYTPTVTLAGKWLYDAGFRSGQRIKLVIENRQIIMRVESEPGAYPTREQLTLQLKRIEKQLLEMPDETEIKQPDRIHKAKRNISQKKAVFME